MWIERKVRWFGLPARESHPKIQALVLNKMKQYQIMPVGASRSRPKPDALKPATQQSSLYWPTARFNPARSIMYRSFNPHQAAQNLAPPTVLD